MDIGKQDNLSSQSCNPVKKYFLFCYPVRKNRKSQINFGSGKLFHFRGLRVMLRKISVFPRVRDKNA
ncbi:MAG: hypothetical protein A2Z25_02255 [Planctomycetes bacterium RBG_16_55_9]|nr:MAG: hypothetical protein A2Z25_02255 [Planctomycetes bacterium RBG_16_55_9]